MALSAQKIPSSVPFQQEPQLLRGPGKRRPKADHPLNHPDTGCTHGRPRITPWENLGLDHDQALIPEPDHGRLISKVLDRQPTSNGVQFDPSPAVPDDDVNMGKMTLARETDQGTQCTDPAWLSIRSRAASGPC